MLKLPPNLRALAKVAARCSTRYAMDCIRLQQTADGYQAVATDGRRMAAVTGAGLLDEVPPLLIDAPAGASAALVPASEWDALLKTCKAGRRDKEPALVAIGPALTTFAIGNALARVPNHDGRYPDVDHVAETATCSLFRMAVDAQLLAELLQVAREYAEDGNRVWLHFGGKSQPMVITTGNDEGQRFQAAMMPLT